MDHLRQECILLPGIVELERLVSSLSEQAHQETYKRMEGLLTAELKRKSDHLLIVDSDLGFTPHHWLMHPPSSSIPNAIKQVLQKNSVPERTRG